MPNCFVSVKRIAFQTRTILMVALLALAGTAVSLFPVSPASMLSAQDVDETTGGWERHPNQLTDAQYSKLQDAKGSLKPGSYQFRVLKSGHCLTQEKTIYPSEIITRYCNISGFLILPHSAGYTIRNFAISTPDRSRARECLTLARGVIIGVRPITFSPCGVPNNAMGWTAVGEPDQIFTIERKGDGSVYEIRPNTIDEDCLATEGGSTTLGARIISWACNSQADQRFELVTYSPLEAGMEVALLAKHGWMRGPDDWQHIAPVGGVDMPGGNYNDFETIADNGKYCASACVANGQQCKGFTWTAAGFDRPKPMCQLKSSLTPPINRGVSSTSQIYSAIVRR